MGNAVTKVSQCCAAASGDISRRHDIAVYLGDPLHGGLGHSFCYVRPDPARLSNAKIHCEEETVTFRSISGASVSANASTPSSTTLIDASSHSSGLSRPSTFESSELFASIPLQPVPRGQFQSGSGALVSGGSGPMERGFLSGPIERGFLSGPIDRGLYSGPVEKEKAKQSQSKNLQRNFSDQLMKENDKPKKQGLIKTLKRAISNTISRGPKPEGIKESDSGTICENGTANLSQGSTNLSDEDQIRFSNGLDGGSELSSDSQNLQWAQGKAGEDRVHIVISEEQGWAFVGIYDGFNGPDAPDYLLSNLYANVHKELNGLLRSDKLGSQMEAEEAFLPSIDREKSSTSGDEDVGMQKKYKRKEGRKSKYQCNCGAKRWKESRGRWRCDWEIESQELDWKSNHSDVLKALSHALKKTEEDYMAIADDMATENPELALMGSCVLVMLMKGDDVYLMNVGDSRAVLAQKGGTNLGTGTASQELGIISEESLRNFDEFDGQELYRLHGLKSLQLTMDHSTFVDTEVRRIKKEHPDDVSAVINDRVKGYLKVTRAFGVGFLKQPKWNDLLLEMFRIDYIGTSPYIICIPSLYHYRLSPWDRFLILSSDGLYQYFTNEEAVFVVDSFLTAFPEGDPAQHLVEEVLFRAAKKAGMDFHELLDIPQGDRRRYHDDVSVIIISLEGRIWRSCV